MSRAKIIDALWGIAICLCFLNGCSPAMETESPERSLPNIVFILADDMGYGDIQAYNPNSKIPTPNLNRLAEQGMRFTDAHSGSAVCSPTRYGLMTGRYSWRTWLKEGVLWPPEDRPLIESDRLTVAGLLKSAGYFTGCVGKWHLGMEWGRDGQGKVDFNLPLRFGPTDVGFDEFFGIAGSLDMIPYAFYHNTNPTSIVSETQEALIFPRFIRQGPRAADFDPEKVLDRLADQAVSFIEKRAVEDTPFFLYFAMTAPHKPVWPEMRFQGKTELGPYGDFIVQTDWTVGRILEALDRTGVSEETLVLYGSDNGSYMFRWPEDQPDHIQQPTVQGFHASSHMSNFIWRGTKADIYEGGHRIPFLVRWPEHIVPGSHCEHTVCLTDFMATCADLVGSSLSDSSAEDSFSLLPLFLNGNWDTPRAPVIHHSGSGIFALRDGKWKMVFGNGSGGRQQPVGQPFEKPYFLYDLEKDPAESENVIEKYPGIAENLQKKMDEIRREGRSRN